jgi:dTDP-4-dehydrorhamnose 3,5-epimerase
MIFVETELAGVWRIAIEPRRDERGYFARAFCRREFEAHGLPGSFVQSNLSFSSRRGTLRGMHLQLHPHGEAKLVYCTRGKVFDAVVDLRPGSPTFARWTALELSATNGEMLFSPPGCAHGYLTLDDDCEVFYQVTAEYHPQSEAGVRWDDPTIAIRWPLPPVCISARDRGLPDLAGFERRLAGKPASGG